MSRAVSLLGTLEDLYQLSVDQVDAEIQELERRLTRLRRLRSALFEADELNLIPSASRDRLPVDRRAAAGMTELQATNARRRVEELISTNGAMTWDALRKATGFNTAFLSTAVRLANIVKGDDSLWRFADMAAKSA